MEAVNMKCPNCMGNVVPYGNGVYGRCDSCGTTFKLRDDDEAVVDGYEEDYEDEEEEDDEEGFDFDGFFREEYDEYVDSPGALVSAFFGPKLDENPNKCNQAIDNLGVDEDADDIYFVLDTTIFGSCKKGFAVTSEGVYMVDEDNDTAFFDWEGFDDLDVTIDGGTITIGGYRFIMSNNEARIVARIVRDLQAEG